MKVETQSRIFHHTGKGFAIGENGGSIKNIRIYSGTVDLGSAGADTTVGANMTCTGVALGDLVLSVSGTTYTDDEAILTGEVSAANTVRVKLHNAGAGAYDHPSETMYVVVLQRQT